MNRYTFDGGDYDGLICYWVRSGNYGVHVDWVEGGHGLIPFVEWERRARLLDRV